jgi:hypothetical protein
MIGSRALSSASSRIGLVANGSLWRRGQSSTYAPWGLESVEGMSRFHFFADQMRGLDGR